MRRLGSFIVIGVLALMVASCISITRLSHTCVVCRLTRVDAACFGLTRSTYYPNACSRWYSSHVEPTHDHVWEMGTCEYTSNLLGMPVSVGCRPGHCPIQLLDPSTQMRVYQHFKKPMEAKALFASLTYEKTHNDRFDEDDEYRGQLMVRAIKEWKSEGFPGNWEDWWAQFYTRHVEERKEWLTWMRADTKLYFREWLNQRKKGD